MNYKFNQLLTIDPLLQIRGASLQSSNNSSGGKWVVLIDFKYSKGLKANSHEFFNYKEDGYKFMQYIMELADKQEAKILV